MMLGDNAYGDGTDEQYQRAVFDMYPSILQKSVLWSTLGNHDGQSASSASESGPYYDLFTLPRGGEVGGLATGTEAYYSFDFGNIHFVCLNSYDVDRSTSGPMLTWLQSDLMATNATWIIAFWHHPAYSKGSHDSDSDTRMREMRENALPILESYGVDLVLAGHSHSYERSMLIDGHYGFSNTFGPSHVVDGGDGDPSGDGAYQKSLPVLPNEGAVYAVAGSSGRISGGSLDHPVMILNLNLLGSMILDFDSTVLDASFLDSTGTIRDTFQIIKGNGTPTPTQTQSSTETPVPTLTFTATETSTETPVPTLTFTATETSTETPVPTLTFTATEIPTGTTTPTATVTPTETPKLTFTPTATSTLTWTPTGIVLPTSTETPTQVPVPTQTPTETSIPTSTFTPAVMFAAVSTVTSTPSVPTCLADAADFNVFVFENAVLSSSDIEGRLAVGGNADLLNYSVGYKLEALTDALIVDGGLIFTNGTIYGNAVVGDNASLSPSVDLQLGGELKFANPIDFAMAKSELIASCNTLASIASNGFVTFQSGMLSLAGSSANLNVFDVAVVDLGTAHTMYIDVPGDSTVLVNVIGAGPIEISNMGFLYEDTSPDRVLFTMCDVMTLDISAVSLEGSLLAPRANIDSNAAVILGQLIGRSLQGFGQANHQPFEGCADILAELGISQLTSQIFDRTIQQNSYFIGNEKSESKDITDPSVEELPRALDDR